jgi:tetratricopeptide (TPR) repeat protein
MKGYKEILLRKYEDFEMEDYKEKKKLLTFEIENILKANNEDLDAEDYFIWGLIYYFQDEDVNWNIDKAIEKFKASLGINSKYNKSILFLAHCFQDKGELIKALDNYTSVNLIDFQSNSQLWRYVKILEQIGYCYYKTGNEEKGLEYFGKSMKFYEKEEEVNLPNPVEIVKCLPENHLFIRTLKSKNLI